jgi:hypothetical protein
MIPMPPMFVIPYGYWYGAPGYGYMPHFMQSPTDFIWAQPVPGDGPNVPHLEMGLGQTAPAVPVQPPMLNQEESEIL